MSKRKPFNIKVGRMSGKTAKFLQSHRPETATRLRPFCDACGWRKGGPHSWNGVTCKCGYSAPPIELVT